MYIFIRLPEHFGTAERCVFFTQHLPENCLQSLWERPFFIAWWACSVNVTERRRGGIPLLCCPSSVCKRKKISGSGEQGEVPSGAVALGGHGTLSRNTFGGSR